MQSKNKRAPTAVEKRHIARVKSLPCSVCDAPGPSEAHEQKQGAWFTSVALCSECHRDDNMGWHGQRRAWKIRKMEIGDALDITLRRSFQIVENGGMF